MNRKRIYQSSDVLYWQRCHAGELLSPVSSLEFFAKVGMVANFVIHRPEQNTPRLENNDQTAVLPTFRPTGFGPKPFVQSFFVQLY